MCRRPKIKLMPSASVRGVAYVIAGRATVHASQDMREKGASAVHAPIVAVVMARVNTSPNCATIWAMTLSGERISNETASSALHASVGILFLHVMRRPLIICALTLGLTGQEISQQDHSTTSSSL